MHSLKHTRTYVHIVKKDKNYVEQFP